MNQGNAEPAQLPDGRWQCAECDEPIALGTELLCQWEAVLHNASMNKALERFGWVIAVHPGSCERAYTAGIGEALRTAPGAVEEHEEHADGL